MMKDLAEVQDEAAARAVRARVLNVLPAATYQMDRFFQFADIVLSNRTETACVEVGPQPRLHLNAGFVRKFCQRDEHLLMLILHELYHVILGHTRLFPRLTAAHNIAFDAVINATLCRQFPGPEYLSFFKRLNGANRFPGRLLRPPKGWPGRVTLAVGASKKESAITALLYGPDIDTVTYQEILDLLQDELPPSLSKQDGRPVEGTRKNGNKPDYVLIGDHDGPNRSGRMDEAAVADSLIKGILRRVTEKWPAGSNLSLERGDGTSAFDFLMPKPKNPRDEFVAALKRLFDKAGILRPEPASPYAWKRVPSALETTTVLPDWRDRHAHSRAALTDFAPLFYRSEVLVHRLRWQPRHVAHVYIDISGSMNGHLSWLAGALEPLQRQGVCRLYAFSTVVDEVRRGGLLKDKLMNTFGTNIHCVYAHLLALPLSRLPRKVVILTDGGTGEPSEEMSREVTKKGVLIHVGLVGRCVGRDALRPYVKSMEDLPLLP